MKESKKKGSRLSPFTRGLIIAVTGVAIFQFGMMVGQGRIDFSGDHAFNSSQNSSLPEDLDYKTVEDVYDTLRTNYDGELDQEKLLNGLKAGLAEAAGDPYTQFLNAEEAKQFNDDLNGTFSGIGAQLGTKDKNVIIEVPLAGYPAEKAGLKARDVITEINGEDAFDITVAEAVEKIRGPEGTKVKLKVVRDNREVLEFDITRAKITIPSVESEIVEGNIGYLKVSRFSDDTTPLVREAAAQFKQAGVKGVVLDLRNNPGGLLDQAIELSSVWLPKGKTVLEEKRGEEVVKTFTTTGNPILEGVPTVVLINGGSASASEITAGALEDHDVATLVGEKTFGKGSVQQLQRLAYGSVLKVTIARWYTPDGKNIDKEGIKPEVEVKRTDEDFQANRDPQREKALEVIRQ